MSKLNQAKLDNKLLTFQSAGEKERYAMEQFFIYLNSKSDQYVYEISFTSTFDKICYDGILIVRSKLTQNILKYFIVETKLRDKDFSDLILEVQKLNGLKKMKLKKDKYFQQNFSDKKVGILYLCFCPSNTYMYDLSTIIENELLPTRTKMTMNKVTVDLSLGKVEKSIYLLPNDLSIKYKYVFTEKDYILYQLEQIQKQVQQVTQQVRQTYSLF